MLNIGSLLVSSLDYILIVDKDYKIIYNTRYDANINEMSSEYVWEDVSGKYYFDIYPDLSPENSSVSRCIETHEIIINKKQVYSDYLGRRFVTNNVTFPLMKEGRLIAVAELAMDVDESDGEASAAANERFDDFVFKLKKEAGLITFDTILTVNEQMKKSIEKAKLLATLPNPTLIYGETGTGKELFAQAMINSSGVDGRKVVIQNCAAVPDNLLETILFGTVKGAYTGAENITGLFEQADGGILFLDELNSIPYGVQPKLLRVLQDGTFRPLGAKRDKHVKVKVIGAMNIDPVEAINDKILRSDLFYRFSSGLINLLPLRERKEDIDFYIRYYVQYFCKVYNKPVPEIDEDVKNIFYSYKWEGNVRELKNTMESMVVTCRQGCTLSIKLIPEYIINRYNMQKSRFAEKEASRILEKEMLAKVGDACNDDTIAYHEIMDVLERELIEKALEKAGGSRSKAAHILGLPRNTLKYRMEKLNIR